MEYRIIRNIAVLGQNKQWIKELNIIRWYNKHDRYDIREWSSDHKFMNRGITLNDREMSNLKEAINGYYFSSLED